MTTSMVMMVIVKHSCVNEKLKLLRLVQGNDASRRDFHIFRSREPATVAVFAPAIFSNKRYVAMRRMCIT